MRKRLIINLSNEHQVSIPHKVIPKFKLLERWMDDEIKNQPQMQKYIFKCDNINFGNLDAIHNIIKFICKTYKSDLNLPQGADWIIPTIKFLEYIQYTDVNSIGKKIINKYWFRNLIPFNIILDVLYMLNLNPDEIVAFHPYENCLIDECIKNIKIESIGGLYKCKKMREWEGCIAGNVKIINLRNYPSLKSKITHIPSFKSRFNLNDEYAFYYNLNDVKSRVNISFDKFEDRFKMMTKTWLHDFPWNEYPNVCVAGGTLLNCLDTSVNYEFATKSDIDLFVLNNDKNTVKSLITHFNKKFGGDKLYYVLQRSVITIHITDNTQTLQIILSGYNNFCDLTCNFDMNGLQLWYSYRGLEIYYRAYFHLLIGYLEINKPCKPYRIIKYLRSGWRIVASTPFIVKTDSKKYIKTNGELNIVDLLKDPQVQRHINSLCYPKSNLNFHENCELLTKHYQTKICNISNNGMDLLKSMEENLFYDSPYSDSLSHDSIIYDIGHINEVNNSLLEHMPTTILNSDDRSNILLDKIRFSITGLCVLYPNEELKITNKILSKITQTLYDYFKPQIPGSILFYMENFVFRAYSNSIYIRLTDIQMDLLEKKFCFTKRGEIKLHAHVELCKISCYHSLEFGWKLIDIYEI